VLWTASIAHVFAGDIDYGRAGTLLIGAIPGILLSTQISLRAPQGALRAAPGVILVGAALGMLQGRRRDPERRPGGRARGGDRDRCGFGC
jgi:uncharacterized membrane protein YfcA